MRTRKNKMAEETHVRGEEESNPSQNYSEFTQEYQEPTDYPPQEGREDSTYYPSPEEEEYQEQSFSEEKGPLKRERSWGDDEPPVSKRPPFPAFNINTNMPSTLRVLLRSLDAGGIIGKGGENIKRLRKKYDCQVQLPDSAGNPERVLTVVGKQTGCIGVFQECLQKVISEIQRRDSGAPVEVQVLIPQPFMGTIIGTGGTKIKDLRKRTGATIKIFSEPMPYSNERSISLSGTEEQIVNSVQFFLQEIGQREPKEPIILYDPALPPDYPPHYDYPPPPPPYYGNRRGGPGRSGRGNFGGRGRGRFNPPAPSYGGSGQNYSQAPPPTGQQATPTNNPPPSSSQAPPMTTPSHDTQAPPSTVQYPQGSQTQQPPSTGNYTSFGGNDYYSNNSYNPQQAPPTAQPLVPPTSSQAPPTNYPQTGYSGYTNFASNYPPQQAPPTGYTQQPYQYSNQPAVAPPTNPYGGSGQYQQQAPPSMFPAAATMATSGYQQGSTSKQVTIPDSYAGSILGQNGSRIQQIRSQSQCNVTIDEPSPGAKERIITIVGTPANIAVAEQLMKDSVRLEHNV